MMNELLQLVVDPILKPRIAPPELAEQGFELIYREDVGNPNMPAVNVRRSFSLDLVYPVAELKPFIGKFPPKLLK